MYVPLTVEAPHAPRRIAPLFADSQHCAGCCLRQRTGVKKTKQKKWKKKMQNSPFHIDLVAESERIDEVRAAQLVQCRDSRGSHHKPSTCAAHVQENRVRLREQIRRQKHNERMREKVKNEIILKACYPSSTRTCPASGCSPAAAALPHPTGFVRGV